MTSGKYLANLRIYISVIFTGIVAIGIERYNKTITNYQVVIKVKVESSPRHYALALGSHEGLYGQCLNLVSVVRSNLECSYTDSPGQDTSPSQVPSKQCLYSFAAE